MVESYQELYRTLIDTELGCVSAGSHPTSEVYEIVESEYPELCDNEIRCRDVCGTSTDQPEWKHRVRTVQQDLLRDPDSRVTQLNGDWFYQPVGVDVQRIPDDGQFQVGRKYNRWELHDELGGQRYSGISTPADRAMIFIFTGDSGEKYGYDDEFLPDDTFIYTGEGTEGDMELESGNAAIRDHRQSNEDLHLFESTDDPWIVTYVGQFEYKDHQWERLPDENGNLREAIRFRLAPIGGNEIAVEGDPEEIPLDELYDAATRSSPEPRERQPSSTTGTAHLRSEVVKSFALRVADGICEGCEEEAPFIGEDGKPFLEVHHLQRLADGGPDHPDNVVALCPNCHRHVHQGRDGDDYNEQLIEKVENRNHQARP
jgi:5-methylcytosine-specific restriction protein A